MPHLASSPAPCTGLWGGTQGVAPGCCSPIFTFLCSGMDSMELSSRVKASFFLLPSLPPDQVSPEFSLWGWTPTLPFPPCSFPQVSWLYLAARTYGWQQLSGPRLLPPPPTLKKISNSSECVCLVWSYSCYRQPPPSWQRPLLWEQPPCLLPAPC